MNTGELCERPAVGARHWGAPLGRAPLAHDNPAEASPSGAHVAGATRYEPALRHVRHAAEAPVSG
jgi:hypothetical protein